MIDRIGECERENPFISKLPERSKESETQPSKKNGFFGSMATLLAKRLLAPRRLGLRCTEAAAQRVVNNPKRIIQHPRKQRLGLHGINVKTNPGAGKRRDGREAVSRSRHGPPEKRRSGRIEADQMGEPAAIGEFF